MNEIGLESIYKEICRNIRETDAISFKLLNLVPLGSALGGGILAILGKNTLLQNISHLVAASAIVLLSLAGATIVFALHKWELRNIQKCKWLIDRASDLEQQGAAQYKGWSGQKAEGDWGKTRAEKLIYNASLLMWMIPIVVLVISSLAYP